MNALERNVLDTLKIVETREANKELFEICTIAQAIYSEASGELRVELDAFVRHFEMRGKDQIARPLWLPRKDLVRTHTDLAEASEAAKEIFESWTNKVRKTIPAPQEWTNCRSPLCHPLAIDTSRPSTGTI